MHSTLYPLFSTFYIIIIIVNSVDIVKDGQGVWLLDSFLMTSNMLSAVSSVLTYLIANTGTRRNIKSLKMKAGKTVLSVKLTRRQQGINLTVHGQNAATSHCVMTVPLSSHQRREKGYPQEKKGSQNN